MSSCIIRLDQVQDQYYPGESVVGKVVCSFSTAKHIEGEEHTGWIDNEPGKQDNIIFSGDNTFLKLEKICPVRELRYLDSIVDCDVNRIDTKEDLCRGFVHVKDTDVTTIDQTQSKILKITDQNNQQNSENISDILCVNETVEFSPNSRRSETIDESRSLNLEDFLPKAKTPQRKNRIQVKRSSLVITSSTYKKEMEEKKKIKEELEQRKEENRQKRLRQKLEKQTNLKETNIKNKIKKIKL
ncbi:hypothetical protein NQ314_002774 [Rhamnusium bicolor]|uniref:CAP-Gly domain-containing protein n=1 Tax=Rhamnusium bicolor TaxID=1586634 RepID=A0AAV8ZQD4_9CUCU|nr:hypothetical protein NQ314_002774 [Rhamnusium bicolor]